MHFSHSTEIWQDFPELVAGVLFADRVGGNASTDAAVEKFNAVAGGRTAGDTGVAARARSKRTKKSRRRTNL